MDRDEATCLLAAADLIHSADTVTAAVRRVAQEISDSLGDSNPLLLCVMKGGVPFAGQLLTQLTFPLDFDYLQVGRYGREISGGALSWRVEPSMPVSGRIVLVVDDILDQGLTLVAIRDRLLQLGAAACYTAVLTEKLHEGKKPVAADFVALTVPDRFVFGYGMDVRDAWRNLPAIYALREE